MGGGGGGGGNVSYGACRVSFRKMSKGGREA